MQLYLFRNILGFFLLYNIQPKNAKKYYCKLCDVIRNKLREYNKNLLTKKT